MKEILTVPEAAAYLRVSRYTVWRWCQAGTLSSAFKIGRNWRLHRSEIEAIIGEDLSQKCERESVEEISTSDDEAANSRSPVRVWPWSERSVDELAWHCQQQTERYRAGQTDEDGYCMELFRRAIVTDDQHAWTAIYAQYQGLVRDWVWRHNRFRRDQDEVMVLVNVAFARFWYSMARQKDKIQVDNLAGLLRYLKSCAHSAVEDRYRQQHRSHKTDRGAEASIERPDDGSNELVPTRLNGRLSPEASVLHQLDIEALAWAVWRRLRGETEVVVATLSWQYGLSPREIRTRRLDLFANVQHVYRVKRTIVERLLGDPEIQKLREKHPLKI